jgi:amidase
MAVDALLAMDATAQLSALAAKRVSAVELLKAALGRHEKTHARLNAVVAVDLERALERARATDDLRVRAESLGPLAGLPMTIKDTLDVAGMPASSGVEAYRRRLCEDAVAVAHARRAGAVIWGKTNVPVLAADWQSFNPLYGVSKNPWDPERTTGGSSGGAAAALAARVTALEIGSDIGGSLRVPASFCGVFSHKPTWGLITQHGHVPPAPGSWAERDLNVLGPMARSARDLRLLLSILSDTPIAATAPPANLEQTKVGLWLDDPMLPLDPEVRTCVEALAKRLEDAGAIVEPISSPVDVETLLRAYVVLLGGVLSEDMPEARIRAMEFVRPFTRMTARNAHPFSPAFLSLAYTARYREWAAADATRMLLAQEMVEVFDRYDVILAPVSPTPAFPHDRRPFARRRLKLSDGREIAYSNMLAWIALATACRLPATVVPAGRTPQGLPVGVQLIGPKAGDAKTLSIAQAIDTDVLGFEAPEL